MTDPNWPLPPPIPRPPVVGYSSVPVEALPYTSYGQHAYRQRPGIITTIGVMSIVVGCLSALSSLVGGCEMTALTAMSKMATRTRPTLTSVPPPVATTVPSTFSTTDVVTIDVNGTVLSSATTQPTTAPGGLRAADIQNAVSHAQRAIVGKLNTAQIAALTTALSDPNQTIIQRGTEWSPVRSGAMAPDGSVSVFFTGSVVQIDPRGNLTNSPIGMPKFQFSAPALIGIGLDFVISLFLAIFLFIAGIMVLRQSFRSRRLHFIYALLKIPLAIGGAVAIGFTVNDFYSGIMRGAGIAFPTQAIAITWAITVGSISILYPISLLIALNAPSVKSYYSDTSH